jgi:hypothetical protein
MKPPLALTAYRDKVPKHALFAVYENGKVENPEFVADHMEGGNWFCWDYRLWLWTTEVYPHIKKLPIHFWQLHDKEFSRFYPTSLPPVKAAKRK